MGNEPKLFNWLIGGYIAITYLGSWWIVSAEPSLRVPFVIIPILLLAWQAILLRRRFLQRDTCEKDLPFYEWIETGDWWRVFWILWIGHRPLASDYLLGFFLFSGVVILLLGILAYTASIEYFHRKKATSLVFGCLAFSYFLLCWEKNTYVEHYGVPIIGHFFEKPEYLATYRVEVAPEDSSKAYQAIAEIFVEGRTESYEAGDNNLGQPITYTESYRDVWVKKIHLPNGRIIVIEEQDEPIRLREGGFVRDSHGRWWSVELP